MLFRSVGYRGTDVCGLPFDERRGVIRNREGRVVDAAGERQLRLYATGWIKRGCTGIIGTNRLDSDETVARLLEDLPLLDAPRPGRSALAETLRAQTRQVVSFDDWRAIERAEFDRGRARQKVAEKFVRVSDMLAAIGPTRVEGEPP
jgi:ferredoxin--NADP+ reductase